MDLAARLGSGEPAGAARSIRDRTVNRDRELDGDPGAVRREGVKERSVELPRRALLDPHHDVDTGLAQAVGATAGDGGRVWRRGDDSRDAGLDQRVDARWRLPEVAARLEAHVHGRAARQ